MSQVGKAKDQWLTNFDSLFKSSPCRTCVFKILTPRELFGIYPVKLKSGAALSPPKK